MSAKPRDLGMTPLDDLFSTDESRAEAQLEKVVTLNPADISDFPNHPFKVKQDEAMAEMVDSVKQYGVLVPALVRPKADGSYEMPVTGENVRQRWRGSPKCPASSATSLMTKRRSSWWTAICSEKQSYRPKRHLPIR